MKVSQAVASLLGIALLHGAAQAEDLPAIKTPKDKANYAIGVNFISNLRQQGVEIDLDLVIRGIRDAHAGGKLALSDEDVRIGIQAYQTRVRQQRSQGNAAAAEENRTEAEAFFARNKGADGVVTLPSGLQYRVLKPGDGRKPAETDTVDVTYRGTLLDGTEFESSVAAGKPATFAVKTALPGWTEALKLMPAGSKWQLFVPAALAYGNRGKAGSVGPHAAVIYELELLRVH